MNRPQTNESWPVMQHFANGGNVQLRKFFPPTGGWQDCDFPTWNWEHYEYRKKPEPIEVTCYAVLCNGSHDGYFATATAACLRCHDLRALGKDAVMVELKGTYTCES